MSDGLEPPPLQDLDHDDGDEEEEDQEDLFSDAKEKPSSPESEKAQEPKVNGLGPPATNPDFQASDDIDMNDDDDDDLFKGGSSEIKLDSDDDGKEETQENVASGSQSAPPVLAAVKEPRPKISISETVTSKTKVAAPSLLSEELSDSGDERDAYETEIKISDTMKMGDGMSAYIVYKVASKTTNPAYRYPENAVLRRFSDFLGLHAKLAEKHVPLGIIVPPAPEKSVIDGQQKIVQISSGGSPCGASSFMAIDMLYHQLLNVIDLLFVVPPAPENSVIGMTKVKMSKEDSGSSDFVERRRAALERFLMRTAAHPVLASDPDFIEFLEKDGDLPKSTSTSALSGAGVLRLFHKVGESFEKITLKVEESDEWFEEKQQQVEALDIQLRKLHSNIEILSQHRRELSVNTASFAKSAAMLGNVEEHTALSRALSQLADTEEKIEVLYKEQAEADFFIMAELMKDYVALMGAVKEVFHERIKIYKMWKDAETTLGKKRDNKTKMEAQNKMDKLSHAQAEIAEWEQKMEKGQEDFEKISRNIKKEMARFEKHRVSDFKDSVIKYLQVLMDNQEKLIRYWEAFLPEAKAIA